MSDIGPFGPDGPFGDIMRNLAQMLTSQGPLNWEIAKQLATWTATGGQTEGNPDPLARVRLEELLRVAEMHAAEATGLETSGHSQLQARVVGRAEWAQITLDSWRPRLESLATSMTPDPATGDDGAAVAAPADPMSQLFGNLPQMLGPFLLGMQSGSMVGQLALRAMGQYDVPVPRPAGDQLLLVATTIDGFAEEWSQSADDVRMWVCLREVLYHAVLRRPHVAARLDHMIGAYVDAFEINPHALEERLGRIDPTDMQSMQSVFGNPGELLGEMRSDTQRQLQVPLTSLLSAISGYVDHKMEVVGVRLVGGHAALTEALHRRRLEEDPGSRILAQLFGVELDEAAYARGQAFVAGIVERSGEDALARLWRSEGELPTPAEVDAPGLWLARIDLPTDL